MKTVMHAVYSVYKGVRIGWGGGGGGGEVVDKFNLGQLAFILTTFYSYFHLFPSILALTYIHHLIPDKIKMARGNKTMNNKLI
jgi:hypothetical protein